MKKLIYLICLISILFIGCNGASDSLKCKQAVEESYPEAIIVLKPTNEKYTFIVIDSDSSLWYVKTFSITSTKITEKELLFKLNN